MDIDIELLYVYIINSCLSTVCCVALVTAWCVMPRWRTLQNYICVNQIITGTLSLVCETYIGVYVILFESVYDYEISLYIQDLEDYLNISVMCWSLCASLEAYIKLVLQYPRRMSCEKRVYSLLVHLASVMIFGITYQIDPNLSEYKIACVLLFDDFLMLLIWTITFTLYVRIVMSIMPCGQRRMSARKMENVLSLAGVAVMCDSLRGLKMITELVINAVFWTLYEENINSNLLEIIIDYTFIVTAFLSSRWVFQTMFVLFRRSSRAHWKLYMRRRRNRNLNNIELR